MTAQRLAQQRRFSQFLHEFNEDRPHEALGMQTPSSLYRVSVRAYPRQLPDWGYPLAMTTRQVSGGGRFHWHSGNVFLSHVLDGETIGLWPLDGRHWQIWIGPLELGVLDGQKQKLLSDCQRHRMETEGTLVCPSSFRCASETRANRHGKALPMSSV